MALVKYNNNSLSSVTSAAGFPAGAMTHIKTLTASSSSTLSFVDGSSDVVLDSTYPIYMFKFINIHPSGDGTLFAMNFSTDSGSNYNVTKTNTMFYARHGEDGSNALLYYDTHRDMARGTGDMVIFSTQGNGADESGSGSMFLFNPSSTTFVKHFMVESNVLEDNSYTYHTFVTGYGNTTSAIDGVKFDFNSGNIDSGTIKLYGIKDS